MAVATIHRPFGEHEGQIQLHGTLSELSPVFDHEEYGKYLILGGDLNILAGKPSRSRPYRGHLALERIKAYGLIDCLEKNLSPDRYEDSARRADMNNCQCGLREACTHTRTYYDKARPHIPYQDDYLFASPALADGHRLVSCTVSPVGPGSPSDHAPIVAVLLDGGWIVAGGVSNADGGPDFALTAIQR